MPSITAYPASVSSASTFTAAQLANVLGNTATYAQHSGAVALNGELGGEFKFDLSALPAVAVVTNIRMSVIARASATSRRALAYNGIYANVSPYPGFTGSGPTQNLITTDTTLYYDTSGAALTSAGFTTALIKDAATDWRITFRSLSATSTITYWQKFWMDIEYELPPANVVNPLILMGVC